MMPGCGEKGCAAGAGSRRIKTLIEFYVKISARLVTIAMASILMASANSVLAEEAPMPNVAITSVTDEPPGFRLTLDHTVSGVEYGIYRSFTVANTWTLIGTALATSDVTTFDDTTLGSASSAFYRVVVPSPIPGLIPHTSWVVSVDSEETNIGPGGQP